MALHKRVELIDTLLEEAEHKRTALTHALHAHELVEPGKESTHGAPPPLRRRAYSTNTICGRESREVWPRCAKYETRSSNWHGTAASASSGACPASSHKGADSWNHGNAPTWSTNSCKKPSS